MMFIYRNGKYFESTGLTFMQYMKQGLGKWRATEADWHLHVGSAFPDVRLKSVIETRMADSGSEEFTLAIAAFWKGILYSPEVRSLAWAEVQDYTLSARREFLLAAARSGLLATTPDGRPIKELACALINYAKKGLQSLANEMNQSDLEGLFLLPFEEAVNSKGTPAQRLSLISSAGTRASCESLRV